MISNSHTQRSKSLSTQGTHVRVPLHRLSSCLPEKKLLHEYTWGMGDAQKRTPTTGFFNVYLI